MILTKSCHRRSLPGFVLGLVVGLLTISTARAQDRESFMSATCVGVRLNDEATVSQLLLEFDKSFEYRLALSEDRRRITLTWPNVNVNLRESDFLRSDSRIESVTPQRAPGGPFHPWESIQIQLRRPVPPARAVQNFWSMDAPPLLQIIIETEAPDGPTSTSILPPGSIVSGYPLPESMMYSSQAGEVQALADALKIRPFMTDARTRTAREDDLERFLFAAILKMTEDVPRSHNQIEVFRWYDASRSLSAQVFDHPRHLNIADHLFARAECAYRSLAPNRFNHTVNALKLYLQVVPEDDVWAPFIHFRLYQIYRDQGYRPEMLASIRAAIQGATTPFVDLMRIHYARVLLEERQLEEARARLEDFVRSFPGTACMAEAHYLLGELTLTEMDGDNPSLKVAAFEHFVDMYAITTAPLTGSPPRLLKVADTLLTGAEDSGLDWEDVAYDLLRQITEPRTLKPVPEKAQAHFLVVQSALRKADKLNRRPDLDEATRYRQISEQLDIAARHCKILEQGAGLANPANPKEAEPPFTVDLGEKAQLQLARLGHLDQGRVRQREAAGLPPTWEIVEGSGEFRRIDERSDSLAYRQPVDALIRLFEKSPSRTNRYEAGVSWVEMLVQRDEIIEALLAAGRVRQRFPRATVNDLVDEYFAANFNEGVRRAFEKKNYNQVLTLFETAKPWMDMLEVDPHSSEYAEAVRANPARARQALQAWTGSKERQAMSLSELGFFAEAAEILRQIVRDIDTAYAWEPPPAPIQVMEELAIAQLRSGDPRGALKTLNERSVRFADQLDNAQYIEHARCFEALGDRDRARQALEITRSDKSLGLDPRTTASTMLADQYEATGDFDLAAKVLNENLLMIYEAGIPLAQSPTAPELLVRLGKLYDDQDQIDSGIRVYEQYVKRFPDRPDHSRIRYRLGQLYVRKGNAAQARLIFQALVDDADAEEPDPQQQPIYAKLARAAIQGMDLSNEVRLSN